MFSQLPTQFLNQYVYNQSLRCNLPQVIAGGFLFVYGKRNPGGVAERIAMRMETSYKKFGGELGSGDGGAGGGGGGGGSSLGGLNGREFNNVDLDSKHVVGENNNDKGRYLYDVRKISGYFEPPPCQSRTEFKQTHSCCLLFGDPLPPCTADVI